MNQIVTKGIVLRRINYGEADRIVTYITPDLGKISLMVKGVRKPKSKLAGSIELFGESQITLILGKGDIGNLISARLIQNYAEITKNLDRSNLTYKIIQLINKHLEFTAGNEFYDLVKESYDNINDLSIDLRITNIWFSLNFLDIMGHQPQLVVKDLNNKIEKYDFNLDTMEFIENQTGEYTRNDIKYLRLALSRKPKFLSKIKISDDTLNHLSFLMPLMTGRSGFEY
jgi:DNA repair protein RecO (recombination protein O)